MTGKKLEEKQREMRKRQPKRQGRPTETRRRERQEHRASQTLWLARGLAQLWLSQGKDTWWIAAKLRDAFSFGGFVNLDKLREWVSYEQLRGLFPKKDISGN